MAINQIVRMCARHSIALPLVAAATSLGAPDAHGQVTGLDVQYGGFVGGKHVWNVFMLNPNPSHRALNIIGHTVTTGTMAGVQHSDDSADQGGSWLPSETPSRSLAFDSFVTLGGLGGPTDTTQLDPGFGTGNGSVIPTGAGWLATPPQLPSFGGGRMRVMQIAGNLLYPGGPGFTGRFSVNYLANFGFAQATGLTYTVPGPCPPREQAYEVWSANVPISAWTVSGVQPSTSAAQVRVRVSGNAEVNPNIRVTLDGQFVGDIFLGPFTGCAMYGTLDSSLPEFVLTIPAATFNAAAADGVVSLQFTPRFPMCTGFEELNLLKFTLVASDVDCDGNGAPDRCQLLGSDCNGNGQVDACDIAAGAPDANGDGIPDSCQERSPDVNGDGVVNGVDLGILLAAWGSGSASSDLNQDGVVNAVDLAGLLAAWGSAG